MEGNTVRDTDSILCPSFFPPGQAFLAAILILSFLSQLIISHVAFTKLLLEMPATPAQRRQHFPMLDLRVGPPSSFPMWLHFMNTLSAVFLELFIC